MSVLTQITCFYWYVAKLACAGDQICKTATALTRHVIQEVGFNSAQKLVTGSMQLTKMGAKEAAERCIQLVQSGTAAQGSTCTIAEAASKTIQISNAAALVLVLG